MSYSEYDRIKEQIRDAIDIVELISRFVPLRRVGRHYVGRCPWHDDSRPSLQVNPERQSFKCWVCDLGGDVFSFVMKNENVDFKESLEILADIAGITIPAKKSFQRPPQHTEVAPRNAGSDDPNAMLLESAYEDEQYDGPYETEPNTAKKNEPLKEPISKKTLYLSMDWVQKQYHEALLSMDEAAPIRDYLKKRGINEQSIRTYGLGYSPMQGSWLLGKIKNDPKRIECLEAVGIFRRSNRYENEGSEKVYDMFYGRLLFPIRDTQDRTIAFGGRIVPGTPMENHSAKYKNSPETPLFYKSNQLYGLDVARLSMRKSHRAIIMEGYTDCIMAHQFGLTDAVAILGTALTPQHIKILKRFAEKMILVLDGDAAGQKKTNELLEQFVAEGVDLSILTLPEGADPCEFLLENGKDAFEEMIRERSLDVFDHAFEGITRGVDLENDILASSQALDKLISIIASAPKGLSREDTLRQLRIEKMIARLSNKFRLDESVVRGTLKDWRKKHAAKVRYTDRPGNENENTTQNQDTFEELTDLPDALERELLELWFADPSTFAELNNLILDEWLLSPITRRLQAVFLEMSEGEQSVDFSRILTRFDDPRMKNYLVEIDEAAAEKGLSAEMDSEKKEQIVTEIVRGFTLRDLKRRSPKEITALKNETLSKEEKKKKLQEIIEQQRERQRGG